MIFVRYKGSQPGAGKFTMGKTYVANTFEEGSAVNFSAMSVLDDFGAEIRENTDSGRFDFMNFVYAVVVSLPVFQVGPTKHDPLGLNVGDAVKLDQISLDGKMFRIEGVSIYYDAEMFEILDWTNVAPGMKVMRLADKKWKAIQAVNDSVWVRLEDSEVFLSPETIKFAVSGGGVAMEPLKRYRGPDDGDLKDGAVYPVVENNDDKILLEVKDGLVRWVKESLLEPV
jgi:hypothetical protein